MAFNILTKLNIPSGLPQAVNTSVTVSEEILTEIDYTIGTGTTDVQLALNIENTANVKLLYIESSIPGVTFKLDYTGDDGWTYKLDSAMLLFGDSMSILDNALSNTSGMITNMYLSNPSTTLQARIKGVIVTTAN